MNKEEYLETIDADDELVEQIRTVMRYEHVRYREDSCNLGSSYEYSEIEGQILNLVAEEKGLPPVGIKPDEKVAKIFHYLKDSCFVQVDEYYNKQCHWLAEKGRELRRKRYPKLYQSNVFIKKNCKDKKIRSIFEIAGGGI